MSVNLIFLQTGGVCVRAPPSLFLRYTHEEEFNHVTDWSPLVNKRTLQKLRTAQGDIGNTMLGKKERENNKIEYVFKETTKP